MFALGHEHKHRVRATGFGVGVGLVAWLEASPKGSSLERFPTLLLFPGKKE